MDDITSLQDLFAGLPADFALDDLETIQLILRCSDDPELINQAVGHVINHLQSGSENDLQSCLSACLGNDCFDNVAQACLSLAKELRTLSASERLRLHERAQRELKADSPIRLALLSIIDPGK
jgi:hypothetical protein